MKEKHFLIGASFEKWHKNGIDEDNVRVIAKTELFL